MSMKMLLRILGKSQTGMLQALMVFVVSCAKGSLLFRPKKCMCLELRALKIRVGR